MAVQNDSEQQPAGSRSPTLLITVLACLGLFVLVTVVVCVVLTLLGPTIGNVFSNIIITDGGI